MILDTNALSAWADGERAIESVLRVAKVYGAIRLELKQAGTPIPVNDTWIAAIARHRSVAIASRDAHFDAVSGIERVSW